MAAGMDYALIVRLLEPLNRRQLEELAARSRVPWQTIYRVQTGRTLNPKYQTVERIGRALADPTYQAPAAPERAANA